MATCDTSELLQEASCFGCLSAGQLELVKVVLLCRILQANDPMATCDVQSLLEDANCLSCLFPFQLSMVQTQLLCEILDSGGGGGGGCACLFGSGSPEGVVVAAEGSTYVRTDTGGFWYKVSGAGNVGWYEGFV